VVAEKKADYLFIVKDNQPTLRQDIADLNLESISPPHTTTDKGHGRLEVRSIWTSTELTGYLDFPYAAQVFAIQRDTTEMVSQKSRTETVYGITSLKPEKAHPQRLLALSRNNWAIENRLHWVRDGTFDEDRSRVRRGASAQVMASLRNLAISLLRIAGARCIAPALHHATVEGEGRIIEELSEILPVPIRTGGELEGVRAEQEPGTGCLS